MKKTFLFITLLFSSFFVVQAQYYFNDVLTTQQVNEKFATLKVQKIKKIHAISKELDGSATEGFSVVQELNQNTITTTSKIIGTAPSVLISQYKDGKIDRSNDVSGDINTTIEYTYDATGHVASITSTTVDTSVSSHTTETHIWQYTNQQPTQMLKIKNGVDTVLVSFVLDETGQVGEEHWKKNGKTLESYFYYYNDKKQLTDIVRFNKRAKKMLPDFVYTYDEAGRLKSMMQVMAGGSNYNTWYYDYNSNGLKSKEVCYNKQKQLMGTIEYTYN